PRPPAPRKPPSNSSRTAAKAPADSSCSTKMAIPVSLSILPAWLSATSLTNHPFLLPSDPLFPCPTPPFFLPTPTNSTAKRWYKSACFPSQAEPIPAAALSGCAGNIRTSDPPQIPGSPPQSSGLESFPPASTHTPQSAAQ